MTNYWADGPPTAIYEGLVSSGLVKNPNLLPQIPQHQSQLRIPMKKPIPYSKTMNQPIMKNKSPIQTGNSALTLSKPSQFSYLSKTPTKEKRRESVDYSTVRKFSLPPETKAVNVPIFDTSPKTQHCTRAESQSMLKEHNERIEKVSVSDYQQLSAQEQFQNEKLQLYSYILSFDEAITKVKTYNSDVAKVLVKIKNYFQYLYNQIPQICNKYDFEIKAVKENEQKVKDENYRLKSENDEHLSNKVFRSKCINKLKETNETLENKLKENEENRNDLEYQAVELKQKIDDLNYRLSKSDELRQQYQMRLVSAEDQIESISKQHVENTQIIESLKKANEGASVDFANALTELEQAKAELQEANRKLEQFRKYEAARVDTGTDPVLTRRKRSGARRQSLSADLFSAGDLSFSSAEFALSGGEEETRIPLSTIVEDVRANKPSIMDESSLSSLASNIPEQPNEKESEEEAEKREAINKVSTIIKLKQVETKESERLVPNEYTIVEEEVEIDGGEIPEGYVLVELAEAPTVTACVDQLLAMAAPAQSLNRSPERHSTEVKSFSWTLRQAIDILHEGMGEPMTTAKCFGDIVTHILRRDFNSEKIAQRIEAALWHSVHTHRPKSQALQFFTDMSSDIYNIMDFRFFSVVFGLAFAHIFPAVDQVIQNPDLTSDNGIFLIHMSYVERIAEITLRAKSLSEDSAAYIGAPPDTRYPRMVSFWDAARALIAEFRLTHSRFNHSIRNALICVGWAESNFVCRQHFLGVIRILKPTERPSVAARMWENALIANNSSNPDTIAFETFMRTLGETKGLPQAVFGLPLCENYDTRLTMLGEALFGLFFFLRTRYTDFVPSLLQSLPAEVSSRLSSALVRMRNGLLCADVPSALLYYRTMLQHSDLRMTELSPITQFGHAVTNNDIARVINHLRMRECLATLLIGGQDTSEEALKEHHELVINV